MKIAYVVHDYHRAGGHSRYVAELASRFAPDHEIHVFANRIESAQERGIQFHHVPAWRATALTTVLTFSIPARMALQGNYDIVHIQGFCGPKGNVITTHQCNEAWYRALARFDTVTWRDRVFRLLTSHLEGKLYGGSGNAHVIAISKRVAHDVREFYRSRSPVHVIYHGVDLETFSPATRQRFGDEIRRRWGLGPGEMVFLFVGNLRKGGRQAIQALSRLHSGVLVFASGSDASALMALAAELGCTERVRFLGATNHVEEVFSGADAFLLPTPYDPFALVCTEAMACGLPVIVSREAGAAELIEHGVNGLVLENAAGIEELSSHMASLMQNRGWAAELGSAARKTVEPMSWDAVAVQTMQVYEELLTRRN
jgi:UDP-glucose:(heptosyl)LPS alpha-1,3-glucosyltransferase